MRVPFFDLKGELKPIRSQLHTALETVLRGGQFILGPEVEMFEREFARYCGAKCCVGVSSGTSALELSLKAAGIGRGDEVITVPNTFIATVLAITAVGATPIFVDVNPHTHNMDVAQLPSAVTKRTKAILPVHLYGQPAEMDPILETAKRHHLLIIEDACQAHGARYRGQRVGTFGSLGCFSFYPTKNLGAIGDAGAVVTRDARLAQRIRVLRNLGMVKKYLHIEQSTNHRLDTIQAAILNVRLKQLDQDNTKRRTLARRYHDGLAGTPFATQWSPPHLESVHHLMVIATPKRTALAAFLNRRGIGTLIHYPIPIHLQPAYPELKKWKGRLPQAERLAKEVLSLPLFPSMTFAQVDEVLDRLREFARLHL